MAASPLECGVCMETYSTSEKIPKSLPCGHTFCNVCLENLNHGEQITCPNDEKKHSVPTEGVQGFPTNLGLLGMLDYARLEDHAQLEFKSAVKTSLDEAFGMKQELDKDFMIHVENVNEMMRNFEKFRAKSNEFFRGPVTSNSLKQIDEKVFDFKREMKNAKDFISRSCLPMGPDVPCFAQMKSSMTSPTNPVTSPSKTVTSPSDPVTSPTKPVTSPTKHVTSLTISPPSYPVAYGNAPSLVFDVQGDSPGEFYKPWTTTVDDKSGDIHIADKEKKWICVYDKDATYKTKYDVGDTPWDLCFTPDRYVAVTVVNNIRIFDNGKLQQSIGKKGGEFGEFSNLHGICVDRDGLMYVCDRGNQRVQVLERSGSVVRVLGTDINAGKLWQPWSVAVHPHTGQVYVADNYNKQVYIYSKDGQYESSIGKNDISGLWPQYVCFRNDGLLCISDFSNHCVHLIRDGHVIQKIGEWGSAPGQFKNPLGTAFTNTGNLVVCDKDNHRLQIFSVDAQ